MQKSIFFAIILLLKVLTVSGANQMVNSDLIGYSVDITKVGRNILIEDVMDYPIIQSEQDFLVNPANLQCNDQLPNCEMQVTSYEATNTYEFNEQNSKGREVKGGFRIFHASRSRQVKEITSIVQTTQQSFVHSSASCSIYQCSLHKYKSQQINHLFFGALQHLPWDYSIISRNQYFNFFESFGTHIISDAVFGGEASQMIYVSSSSREKLQSSGVSVTKQAQIQFGISAGVSKTNEHNTSQRNTFKENTKSDSIKCFGGNPMRCPNWSSWSQTIAQSPVPITYTLESLDVFLNGYILGGYDIDGNYIETSNESFRFFYQNFAQNIRLALIDYFDSIEESLPNSIFAADATRKGTSMYMTQIPMGGRGKYEGTNQLPNAISINFAPTMQRNNAYYYLTDWQITQQGKYSDVATILVKVNSIEMHLTNNVGLWNYYDSRVSRWNKFDQGFWVPTIIYARPTIDTGYQFVTRARQMFQMIENIQDVVDKINFISVSFADSQTPTEFYPLTIRYSPNKNYNPVSMHFDSIGSNTRFVLEMQDNSVFSKWDEDLKWSFFNSGFFRVVMYTNIPDYDSSWKYAEAQNIDHVIPFAHGIGVVPALVQCFFSTQASMKFASPLTYCWNQVEEFNPTSIRFNDKEIRIEMRANTGKIYGRWLANDNRFTFYNKGYFRCVAYKSSSSFDKV